MRSVKHVSLIIGSLSLVLLFQNCGGVDFDAASAGSLKTDVADLSHPPIVPPEEEIKEDDEKHDHHEHEGDKKDCHREKKDLPMEGLPYGEDLENVLEQNEACSKLFAEIETSAFPHQEHLHIYGLSKDIRAANVGYLKVTGVARLIAAKNVGVAKILGLHGSLCIQAEEIDSISGLTHGTKADVSLIGPINGLGRIDHISGSHQSDLTIVNFHVKRILGHGRSLHLFGSRVEEVSGFFEDIHLYNGAVIENINGLHGDLIRH